MRFKTMLEVAQDLGLKLPSSEEEQKKFFLLTHPLENLGMVLGKFRMAQTLLHSYEILERLAYEVVSEAATENIKILELRYSPTFIQEGHSQLEWDLIHQAFLKGIHRAKQIYEISVGLILIIQRTRPVTVAQSIVDFAINHKDTVLGLDLADNEDGFDASPFEALFQRGKAHGLHITIHAGEVPTPQSAKNVEHAIQRLGAERIGHGIQSITSPSAMQLLLQHKIPLEICPSSNYLTQVVPKIEQHPLRAFWNAGVKVTINTDDPGIFNYTLNDELLVTQSVLGFSENELKIMQKTAFESSFISEVDKQKYTHLF